MRTKEVLVASPGAEASLSPRGTALLGRQPFACQGAAGFIDPPEIDREVLREKRTASLGLHTEW